jgi:hypothetical protein
VATPSNCGDSLKALSTKQRETSWPAFAGRGNLNACYNGQSAAKPLRVAQLSRGKVQRLDGGGPLGLRGIKIKSEHRAKAP